MKKFLTFALAALMLSQAATSVIAEDAVPAEGLTLAEGSRLVLTDDGYIDGIDGTLTAGELKAKFSISKIFPWFILGFVAMSIVASIFAIPTAVVAETKSASKFLMVCALSAIGLNTSFRDMKKSGIRPMIHGFIISALVVVVALLVEICMGIV